MHVRKPPKHMPLAEFTPWTTASFQTEEDRDKFLSAAATLPVIDVEVEPAPGDRRGASVRWRPGKFLGVNDLAYAHGGRITVARRRLP